jgi:hypothetical protein
MGVLLFQEWGNPQDPRYYEYIKAYSPYDNVMATEYPNILVTAGEPICHNSSKSGFVDICDFNRFRLSACNKQQK